MLPFDSVWHLRELFSGGQGRQHVWRAVGERFADVNLVDLAARGGGGDMVWAGVRYGQRTQHLHFECTELQ